MNEVLRAQGQDNSQRWIETAETKRDLARQLEGLGGDDQAEIQFLEWSPGRRMVTLWYMESGESVTLPRYQALAAINAPSETGGYRFTAHPYNCDCGKCGPEQRAPKPFIPSYPCFLHPQSEHRELLRSLGINATCMTMLADEDSAEKHANRHPSRWARLQRELDRREVEEEKAAQRKQTEAILSLAGSKVEPARSTRAKPVTGEPVSCPTCGKECANDFGLRAHMRSHKEASE